MQTTLTTDWSGQAAPFDEAPLDIVIVYEDAVAGRLAMEVASRVLREQRGSSRHHRRLWRFDVLEDQRAAAAAMEDGIEADILIVATSGPSGLKSWVENWLAACLASKRGTPTSVIALLGPSGRMDGPDSPRYRFLKNAARDAGLDFFAPQSCRIEWSESEA